MRHREAFRQGGLRWVPCALLLSACPGREASGPAAPSPEGEACADASPPTTCARGQPWTDVTAGSRLTCGVRADGCAECWGPPAFVAGETDTAAPHSGYAPYVLEGPWSRIVLARYGGASWSNAIACGIDQEGTARCWVAAAPDAEETLGDDYGGVTVDPQQPLAFERYCFVQDPVVTELVYEYTGGAISCAARSGLDWPGMPVSSFEFVRHGYLAVGLDGRVWSREKGAGPWWELKVGAGAPYVGSDGDGRMACAVDARGGLSCAEAPDTAAGAPRPLARAPSGTYRDVCILQSAEAQYDVACALRTDGAVVCWGPGAEQPPADARFTTLSCGYQHACGVTTEQGIACWGKCGNGECDVPG